MDRFHIYPHCAEYTPGTQDSFKCNSPFLAAMILTGILTDKNPYQKNLLKIQETFHLSKSHSSSANQSEWGRRRQSRTIIKPVGVVFVYVTDCLHLSTANDVHLSSGPKEYLGMLEYKREDEAKLIQNLILGSET